MKNLTIAQMALAAVACGLVVIAQNEKNFCVQVDSRNETDVNNLIAYAGSINSCKNTCCTDVYTENGYWYYQVSKF